MDDTDEIVIQPNYPGLLLTIGLLGIGVCLPALLLPKLLHDDIFGPAPSDWVFAIIAFMTLILLLLGSLLPLLDNLCVLFSGIHPSLAVRIDRQGIRFPKRHGGQIPWQQVRSVQTHNGYNGENVWILVDSSLSLRGFSVLDRIYNLGVEERVNYLRLQSHQYRFSAPQLLQKLRELAPDGVNMAYRLN